MRSYWSLIGSAVVAIGLQINQGAAADLIPEPEGDTLRWSITPRVWYLWENDAFFQGSSDFFQQSNEVIDYPFYGGSVSLSPGAGETSYSLTILYGAGEGQEKGLGIGFGGGGEVPVVWEGDASVTRFDAELVAQIPIADGANIVLGGRYINFKRDEDVDGSSHDGSFEGHLESTLEQDFYLAEAGLGLSRSATDDGRFIFFGNLTGMVGYADVVKASADLGIFNLHVSELEGGVLGVDANAGVGYQISENLFWSARYRLFYLSAPDFALDVGGTFMHGPEVNLTISFP